MRYSTGNHYVAIPDVLKSNCGILDISFLYKFYRSVIELRGTEQEPFLEPVITVDGRRMDLSRASWTQERHWIPSFRALDHGLELDSRICAPLGHRGFVWVLDMSALSEDAVDIEAGWRGQWLDAYHVISISKSMRGERFGGISPEHGGVPFVEFRGISPLFSVAFCPSEPMLMSLTSDAEPGRAVTASGRGEVAAGEGEGIKYSLSNSVRLGPGEHRTVALYVGLGMEEMSAVMSAVDLERHGWEDLYSDTVGWLGAHSLTIDDPQLNSLLNLNSFYNYFFAESITLDTEELVLVTSRSSRHGAGAVYRERDAMRWSLPAVLQIDPAQARKMIEYAFNVQLNNVGIHSRFIDGIVLEPGFHLDQLCAPIRALSLYVRATRDISILYDRRVQTGVNRIRQILMSKRHPSIALYETMLTPMGELAAHPYVTYDNVLTWRALHDLEWMYELIHDLDRSEENKQLAKQIHQAVMLHCVVDGPMGPMFARSVDLQGGYEIGDDPAGSLQLLSWLEFCSPDFPAYQNTVRWVNSEENPGSFHDAPFALPGAEGGDHPHVVNLVNALLAGDTDRAVDILRRAPLDDGIASETIDENTGEAASGRAYATCAGYLAFALSSALGTRSLGPEPEPTPRLYEPPPPEFRDRV